MTQTTDPRIQKQLRLDPQKAAPAAIKAMVDLSKFMEDSALEPSLQELVKIRASQINGCAFCLRMHTNDARAAGESDDRMHLLNAWRESPLYTPRERAALAWTEALTRIAVAHAGDADYQALTAEFSDREQVELTLLINIINAWNRFAIAFHKTHPVDKGARAA